MGVATVLTQRAGSLAASLQRLRALVLLAGSVRSGRFTTAIARPIYQLPVENGVSLLDLWRRQAAELARQYGAPATDVRVMIDRASPEPTQPQNGRDLAPARIERDPMEFRGTGGVLRDLSLGYQDEDLLLVANVAQVLLEPLAELWADLAAAAADVSIISHGDGIPSGLLLVRCGALRQLPEAGFIDMKEQALPAIAASHPVAVVQRQNATAMPVRSLPQYIQALRRYHRQIAGKMHESAFEEDWETAFSIVEDGAVIDSTARLHDSVVLQGGIVESGGVVVHGVVCPGGVVRQGRMVVDELVAPANGGRNRS